MVVWSDRFHEVSVSLSGQWQSLDGLEERMKYVCGKIQGFPQDKSPPSPLSPIPYPPRRSLLPHLICQEEVIACICEMAQWPDRVLQVSKASLRGWVVYEATVMFLVAAISLLHCPELPCGGPAVGRWWWWWRGRKGEEER